MTYLELFFGFLYVGCFSFGGAYGAIPLIRDVVLGQGWLTDAELTYMIAVSESTPGPIMINLATYVGSTQAVFAGMKLSSDFICIASYEKAGNSQTVTNPADSYFCRTWHCGVWIVMYYTMYSRILSQFRFFH